MQIGHSRAPPLPVLDGHVHWADALLFEPVHVLRVAQPVLLCGQHECLVQWVLALALDDV